MVTTLGTGLGREGCGTGLVGCVKLWNTGTCRVGSLVALPPVTVAWDTEVCEACDWCMKELFRVLMEESAEARTSWERLVGSSVVTSVSVNMHD